MSGTAAQPNTIAARQSEAYLGRGDAERGARILRNQSAGMITRPSAATRAEDHERSVSDIGSIE